MGSRDISALVALAYEAAFGRDIEWRLLLERLRDAFDGLQASVFIQGLGSAPSRMLSLGDPDLDHAYNEHFGAVNPWFTEGAHLVRPGRVVTSDWYAPEELRRTEFYAGFLRPQKMFYAINGFIFERPGFAGNVAVAKSWASGSFSSDDTRLLEVLLPHLRRAIEIQRRAPVNGLDHSVPLGPAMDSVPYALIFTDARGCVTATNSMGEAILQEGSALLRGPQGELRAVQSDENTLLRRTLMSAIETGRGCGLSCGGLLAVSRADARPLAVLVSPLRAKELVWQDMAVGALLMIADPESRARPSPMALMKLYGLTRREAELASRLALGESLDCVAQAMSIGREAARTHLSRVLQKTDTHRQAELVRMLMVGVPPRHTEEP